MARTTWATGGTRMSREGWHYGAGNGVGEMKINDLAELRAWVTSASATP